MKSVGEAMAIGRTFQESLQKALRGLETGIDGLARSRHSRSPTRRATPCSRSCGRPARTGCATSPTPFARTCRSTRCSVPRGSIPGSSRRSPTWSARKSRSSRRASQHSTRQGCGPSSARVLPTAGSRVSPALPKQAVRERRHSQGIRPVYKRVDTCAAEFASVDAVSVLDLRRGMRGAPTRAQDHDPRRRPEPHRPGHRVRLLLRARGAGAARGRLRDHHGQLQSRRRSPPITTRPTGCTSSRSRFEDVHRDPATSRSRWA